MGANDRTVQHLRLRARSEQAATRAVHRLEDALRCASLPDTGERLLLVRRLDLGRVSADWTAQSLSLLIEQRVRATGGTWVHGEQAAASTSETVFFASRWQAAQVALLRRARGQTLSAWYWPLALPGLVRDEGHPAFLHSVWTCLAQEVDAAVGLPAVFAQLVQQRETPWLLQHLSGSTVQLVLAHSGAQRHMDWASAWALAQPAGTVAAYQWTDTAAAVQWCTLPIDTPVWLLAVLRAAPGQLVVQAAAASARALAQHAAAPLTRLPAEADSAAAPPLHKTLPAVQTAEPGLRESTEHVAGPMAARAEPLVEASPVDAEATATAQMEPSAPWPMDCSVPTQAGGLLFLLPVLERLGWAAWQNAHPDTPLAALVLRQALLRLRLPEADPAWALVQSLPQPASPHAICWTTPERWADARIAVPHAPGSATTPEQMAAHWLTAVRRYLRRVARIGLASLCLRHAALQWGPTHLDVLFRLSDTDMRVRRAALDLDPGWLPWLGRVVVFQYRLDGSP
ncbi:hypothetical protein [Hydrogenophaga sp.]|uniref:hypothetical protein n=1 Tax=Hydrogenophaga sp. TaxID=1904254 RepID=UPI0035675163